MKKSYIFIIIIVILALIALFNSFYVVDEREQVIITQFGKPVGGAIKEAGLHIKVPFLQKVHYFDKRILEWDGDAKQIPTSDKRYIWLDTFSRWQIVDPLKFYETTRYESNAHSRLDDIISGITRDVISSNKLLEIVRSSNREMIFTAEYSDSQLDDVLDENIINGRRTIADSIFALSKEKVAEYGINLIDVRVKRLNYNDEVQSKVFERMISERNKIAAKYLSEGSGNSSEILGKMQRELDLIQSTAYQKAQEIKGKADASAIKIYANAYNKDPEFYEFLKTLETYERTIDSTNTIIMTTDGDYYKFLKKME
ncbi:MAG: protease modulator HflC [Candidatus Cloacimonetes bacterium]|nr:protease modulator HflC [Candidatus Cloacimonadota bacterium]